MNPGNANANTQAQSSPAELEDRDWYSPLSGEEPQSYVQATRRILIADDDRDWADALAGLLEEKGWTALAAYDGSQVITAAGHFQPQVMILDINMPNLGGLDVARIFGRYPADTRPVLIAVTAAAVSADRAQSSGFDHYLRKPADLDELLALLNSL